MARRPELEAFARKHGLKIGTIADLIRYRLETEKTVERVHEAEVETEIGPFRLVVYRDLPAARPALRAGARHRRRRRAGAHPRARAQHACPTSCI